MLWNITAIWDGCGDHDIKISPYTVRCRDNAVNIYPNPHKIYIIAFFCGFNFDLYSTLVAAVMCVISGILDRGIAASDATVEICETIINFIFYLTTYWAFAFLSMLLLNLIHQTISNLIITNAHKNKYKHRENVIYIFPHTYICVRSVLLGQVNKAHVHIFKFRVHT